MRVLFVYQAFENLGLEYLSAALKQNGHTTALAFDPALFCDTFVEKPSMARVFSYERRLLEQAAAFKPDLVAFGVLTPTYLWALNLAGKMKALTGAPVVFGGLHTSASPDHALTQPGVDFVIVGEGDLPLLALVEHLEGRRAISDVPNLAYRQDGEVMKTPLAPFADLDRLPWPDKDLFYDQSPHFNFGYMTMASRGCQMRCSFCVNSFVAHLSAEGDSGFLRQRSVENVIAELVEARRRYGFNHIRFYDDCLNHDKAWFGRFAEAYASQVRLPYWCFTSPDLVDREVLEMLEASGCYEVQMGVQTIHERTRRRVLHRQDTDDQVRNAIALFSESSIHLAVDNIVNVPGQTQQEILDMADFYVAHRPDRVNAYWMTYYPGARIIPIAVRDGYLTQADVDALYRAPRLRAMQVNRPPGRKGLHRLHSFLIFSLLMPKPLYRFVRALKLYRFFPSVDPLLTVGIAYRLKSIRKYAHIEGRVLGRYLTYMKRALCAKVGALGKGVETRSPVS